MTEYFVRDRYGYVRPAYPDEVENGEAFSVETSPEYDYHEVTNCLVAFHLAGPRECTCGHHTNPVAVLRGL